MPSIIIMVLCAITGGLAMPAFGYAGIVIYPAQPIISAIGISILVGMLGGFIVFLFGVCELPNAIANYKWEKRMRYLGRVIR